MLLDVHLGGEESTGLLARLRAEGIPVALVTGIGRHRRVPRRGRRRAAEAVRAAEPSSTIARRLARVGGVSSTRFSAPTEFESQPRAVPLRALRGVARRARRREGGLGAGGDRPPLRRPLQPRAARRAARGRGARDRRRARAALPPAQDLRGRPRLGRSSPSARTSSRTACSRRASRSRARRCRCATRRRSSRCCRATPTARSSARSRPRRAPRSTPTGSSCMRASEELAAELLGDRRCRRAERGGEGQSRCTSSRARCTRRASRRRRATRRCARRWFARLLGDDREDVPSSYHTAWMRRLSPLESTYTKRPRDGDLPADARGARVRPERAAEHQARSRRPSAEVAARVRDRERPAEGRAPDHARAGRAARLPGVPARGGARAALRAAATRTCRTSSAASRATTR